MGWTEQYTIGYRVVKNLIIEATADIFELAGSMACIAGGAGMAVSFAMDDTLTISYFGSALASGEVFINAGIKGMGYDVNDTIPFSQYQQVQGDFYYDLNDFIAPSAVRTMSGILVGSGSLLRMISAHLKVLHTSHIDQKNHEGRALYLAHAAGIEYRNKSIESLSLSIFWAGLGYILFAYGINYSGWLGSSQRIGYPSEGFRLNGTDYNGPLASYVVPFDFSFNKTLIFDLFGFEVESRVDEVINANANASYGGRAVLQSNNHTKLDLAGAAVLSTSAYLAHRFFSKKATEKRDERIIDAFNAGNARRLGYYMI